ncbi:MAG: hypothetical protein LBG70_01385, partial [Bifidobacteriaceae bacterium]|nr:hypothetical protein [Bifidobacteriaceae bacterium]
MRLIEAVHRSYDWGSTTALPDFLGWPASQVKLAELWYGAHPLAPSPCQGSDLAQVIAANPQKELGRWALRGPDDSNQGGQLPYLLKLLGVARPLSLQAHPTASAAAAGFQREQSAKLPLDSPQRTFRDPWHKPELLVALSDFDVLAGWRGLAAVRQALAGLGQAGQAGQRLAQAALQALGEGATDQDVRRCLPVLLGASAVEVAEVVAAVRLRSQPNGQDCAWRLLTDLANLYPNDPGVLVALLLEHRHLSC